MSEEKVEPGPTPEAMRCAEDLLYRFGKDTLRTKYPRVVGAIESLEPVPTCGEEVEAFFRAIGALVYLAEIGRRHDAIAEIARSQ